MAVIARIGAIERMTRICSRSETINRAELELAARIRATRRLAEIGVADDAGVAVRAEVFVVEHVEHAGPEFDAVAAGQPDRARQAAVRVPYRGAACRIRASGGGHVP